MPQVRIKDRIPQQKRGKGVVWDCICKAGITVYKLTEVRGAFYIVCNETVAEELITQPIIDIFRTANLEVLTPPETNAKRTIILKSVDERVLQYSKDEIKQEIEKCNSWASVNEVVIIPNVPYLIKIKFNNIQSANLCIERGLLLFNQSFNNKSIEK